MGIGHGSGIVAPWRRLGAEQGMEGAPDENLDAAGKVWKDECIANDDVGDMGAKMEIQGSVGIDCEAVDGGDTFADAPVVDLGHEAVVGDKVLASSDAVGEGQSAIDEGCGAVDGDRDSDNGDERVEEWGIVLPNERGGESERPHLRLGLGLEMFGDVGADNDTDDRAGVLAGVVTSSSCVVVS